MGLSSIFRRGVAAIGLTEQDTETVIECCCERPEICPCCDLEKADDPTVLLWFLLGCAVCISFHAARI